MPQRRKILEALGYRVSALTRIVVKKARDAPLVGKIIGYVEDRVSPWLEPAIVRVEKDGLYLLSLFDNQIHTVSDLAMAHVPFAAKLIPHMQTILSGEPIDIALMVLDRVRTRGVIGSTADAWVDYEPMVKSESEKIYGLVVRVPGAHIVVSILQDIGSPFVSIASDWLVTRTEFKDKHEIFLQRERSPPSFDSHVTPSKVPSRDESEALGFNALADESDTEGQNSSDLSYAEAVKSKGAAQKNEGGLDKVAVKEGESASTDDKGKFPELTVVHEREEERDDVSDLFDTWGMGVKAIGPESLLSIRSLSLKEGVSTEESSAKPFTSFARSFRF